MRNRVSILLLCSGGNSTSLIVGRMKSDLQVDEEWHIEARGYGDLRFIIGKFNYVLIAPQIMFQFEEIKKIVSQYEGIRLIPINSKIYAACDGHAINNLIREDSGSPSIQEREEIMSEKTTSFMDRFSDWMAKYIVPVGQKISNQRHLAAVKDGLTVLIPATIVGGFAILLAVPPVPAGVTEPSNFFYLIPSRILPPLQVVR